MMDLRGQQQEKRLGLSNSLGGFNPPTIGDPPTKISSINTTTGNGIAILTSPRHSGATLDHHNHHHQQQQQQQHFHHHHQQQRQQQQQQQQNQNHNRQDESSPEPPPPPPPPPPPQHHQHQQHHQTQAIDTDTDRDPDPVSIAVVSAAIQPISTTTGSNPRTPRPKIRYRECLKNHAASIGGHVVDGCGEFMPGGEEGSAEALKCAACDCHRNFHRKEFQGDHHHHHLHHHSHQHGVGGGGNCFYCYNNNNNNNKGVVDNSRRNTRIPAQPIQHHPQQQQQQKFSLGLPLPPSSGGSPPVVMMTFGGGGGGGAATESSSEELNTVYHSNAGGHVVAPQFSLSKKRFRTKFSQEQKDRMLEFAEKVGWRIQKQDENAVQQFCAEVGVKRQVFKVWMHNNKHAIKKKDLM
ncbi:hypothetical protein Scep_020621 [Stephania cephalantha]|uniref:ZF-HD dimerization-type domain-containing protein n=1 Tax=Stephania cephalantha TaxID=152367 RepID=A0AAP0IE85_9MAGN